MRHKVQAHVPLRQMVGTKIGAAKGEGAVWRWISKGLEVEDGEARAWSKREVIGDKGGKRLHGQRQILRGGRCSK